MTGNELVLLIGGILFIVAFMQSVVSTVLTIFISTKICNAIKESKNLLPPGPSTSSTPTRREI